MIVGVCQYAHTCIYVCEHACGMYIVCMCIVCTCVYVSYVHMCVVCCLLTCVVCICVCCVCIVWTRVCVFRDTAQKWHLPPMFWSLDEALFSGWS